MVREEIAKRLGKVKTGSFASRRTAPTDDLVLGVDGLGLIPFPIAAKQAQRLLAVASPAHYGRRERTLLDRRVRDTGEIPASRIEIDQGRWKRTLEPMLAALASDLGLAPGLRLAVELHSLLVYGPGQFFKPHQDSERNESMVGTLVVTLPSAFTGGAMVVEHQGEAFTFRATAKGLSFLAFYADCRHEVRPVRNGYRVVLTYDLLLQGEAKGASPVEAGVVDALAPLLRAHFSAPLPRARYAPRDAPDREPAGRLVYLLDHQYSERGLAWQRLKGTDALRAETLAAAADRADCELVLALAKVHETRECEEPWEEGRYRNDDGYDEEDDEDDERSLDDELPADDPSAYPIGDLIDSSLTLERWIERGGEEIQAIQLYVPEEEVCATTPSSALTPVETEYEGYMGNYGNTMDRWYRRAAVVLWPRERAFGVRAEAAPAWALGQVLERLRAGDLRKGRRMAASLLPSWKDAAWREGDRSLFAPALRVAVALQAQKAAQALLEPFCLEAFTAAEAKDFEALVGAYGEGWAKKLLAIWSGTAPRGWGLEPLVGLSWLASLRVLCEALLAAETGSAAPVATRLLVGQAWQVLKQEVDRRLALERVSEREPSLLELVQPILAWMESASLVAADRRRSSTGKTPGDTSIERAVSDLCAEERLALVPCLVSMLRLATAKGRSNQCSGPDLDTIARHCASALAALVAVPARSLEDWTIVLPTGCNCNLCRKLESFLVSPTQRHLEWPLAKAGRQHVHIRIDRHQLPVRHQTRRTGSPYTLVLEKSNALFSHEAAARSAWKSDLDWLSRRGLPRKATRPRK